MESGVAVRFIAHNKLARPAENIHITLSFLLLILIAVPWNDNYVGIRTC